jgi:catechol 2,3-dioxygenase-like lactoylglutathione lyase family enzyme
MYDIHPVLAVEDVADTVVWYRNVLGFKGDLRGNDFAMLRRDSVTLFFQQADVIRKDRGRPFEWDVYLRVANGQIAEVFQRVKDGAVVLRDLDVGDKGQAEFEIEDCNGYVLCFGEETGSEIACEKNEITSTYSTPHHTMSLNENAFGMMEHFWHDGTQ